MNNPLLSSNLLPPGTAVVAQPAAPRASSPGCGPLMISAGELSGDRQAGRLVEALREEEPSLECFGLGGEYLRGAGVELLAETNLMSSVGALEPLRFLPGHLRTLALARRALIERRPSGLVLVDAPGFNLRLLGLAGRLGIPVSYYISPQSWIWGAPSRALCRSGAQVLCLARQEAEIYREAGALSVFVGHPVLDLVQARGSREALFAELGLERGQRVLAVFPGSRAQELSQVFPVLLEAAAECARREEGLAVVVSQATASFAERLEREVGRRCPSARIHRGNSHELIAQSSFSLATSGTVALEHVVLGTPLLVAYRFAGWSWPVVRLCRWGLGLRGRRLPLFSWPNLLAGRRVIGEYLQGEASPPRLADAACALLGDPAREAALRGELLALREQLGAPGAARRAARAILERVAGPAAR